MKKKIGVFFFFPVAGTNEKKKNNEKNNLVQNRLGYCPNCIVREGLEWLDFVSQYNNCIVTGVAG